MLMRMMMRMMMVTYLYILLLMNFFIFTSCKRLIMKYPCYYTDDQDPEVEIARLHGLIGQKDAYTRTYK